MVRLASRKIQQGFSLIEVLIASFILFIVITTMTLVYRGAVLSSEKAENSLILSTYSELLIEQIKIKLKANHGADSLEEKGSLGELEYSWQANIIESKKSIPRLNAESGNNESSVSTFSLWQVNLQLKQGSSQRSYSYRELSW